MPTIDLSEIYAQVKPWDLVLTLDGQDLRVKRLTAIDVAKIQSLTSESDEAARAALAALFEDGQTIQVKDWDAEKIALVVHAITEYYGAAVVKKKLADVRTAVATATATATRR
jgi:hypothetical protein